MGCCQSREHAEGDGEVNGAAPRRVNHGAAVDGPARSLSDVNLPQPAEQPPDDATSQALRPPTPLADSPADKLQAPPPWTRGMLERQRQEFFDTRVSGDPIVWATIQRICEVLRQTPPDVAEAQAMLHAADLRCVRGRIASNRGRNRRHGGIYDRLGQLYAIPPWVVSDPQDLIEDGAEKDEADTIGGAVDDSDDDDLKVPRSPREEKGKGRAESPGRTLQVKCRRSDRNKDHFVAYNEKLPAHALLMALQDKVGDGKEVRLMLGGKRVDLSKTLAQQGWSDGRVINAFVSDIEQAE